MHSQELFPPLSTNIGEACYSCWKEEGQIGRRLQRCSRCKRVVYCGADCQKRDWAKHKSFCKALEQLEAKGPSSTTVLLGDEDMGPGESSLNAFAYCCMLEDVDTLRSILGRELTIPERNMLGWEPRCATCASTERMLRARQSQLPGASNQGNTGSGAASFLEPCPTCRTTFFCSREHQKLAQQFHNGVKTSTACGNLTQCQANQLIREDVRLSSALKDAPRGLLVWAPERTKTQWESFKGSTWKQEFLAEVQKGIPLPRGMTIASFLHTFSEGLSIPMTILHALDTLNGENTDWTRKHKLVIHVLGAARLEIQNGMVFEEVVHRLPQLKEMEVVMYGPELQQLIAMDGDRVSMNMDTCPKCQRAGRKRVHTYIARLYHSDVTHSSPKPDLAIAFDAGVAAHQDLWKPTIKLLVEQEIPSVFTSFNEEEAQHDSAFFVDAGASLVDGLGPTPNPWGSMLLKTEPGRLHGFYSVNGWLSGGWKGRK